MFQNKKYLTVQIANESLNLLVGLTFEILLLYLPPSSVDIIFETVKSSNKFMNYFTEFCC